MLKKGGRDRKEKMKNRRKEGSGCCGNIDK